MLDKAKRQAESLRTTAKLLEKEGITYFSAENFLNVARLIESLAEQLEAAQHKWIGVEERLPVEDETVIVCADDGCVYAAQYWGHGNWRRELIGCIRSDTDVTPTHWMPLPEPPKEVK